MFLVSVLLASTMAMAADPQPSSADVRDCQNRQVQRDKDIPAAKKKELYDMCIATKVSQVKINQANARISNLQKDSASCVRERTRIVKNWWPDSFRTATSADLQACANSVKAAEDEQASLVSSLEKQKTELERAEAGMTVAMTEAGKEAQAQRDVASVVQNEFKTMQMSVLSLLREGDKGAAKIDKMAQAIDNSALGIYMRDRLAGAMSSPAMCAAVKSCPTPGKVSGKDLNSVFNSKVEMSADEVPRASVPAPTSKGGTTQ